MKIRTIKGLRSVLMDIAKEALRETADDVTDIIVEEVDQAVYSSYTPTMYNRTGELRDSIEMLDIYSSYDSIYAKIGHNFSKIGSYAPNQHMSVVDGSSSAHSIAEIVHEGKAPNIFNDSSYIWEEKRPYMQNAKNRLKTTKEHVKYFKNNLLAMGLDVKS